MDNGIGEHMYGGENIFSDWPLMALFGENKFIKSLPVESITLLWSEKKGGKWSF